MSEAKISENQTRMVASEIQMCLRTWIEMEIKAFKSTPPTFDSALYTVSKKRVLENMDMTDMMDVMDMM